MQSGSHFARNGRARLLAFMDWYTSNDLSGCSMFSVLHNMLDAVNRDSTTLFVEWTVPWRTGTLFWPEGYFDKPWIHLQPNGEDYVAHMDQPLVGVEYVEPVLPRMGRVIYDAVLNQKFAHTAAIAHAIHVPKLHRYWVPIDVPVINWVTETRLDVRLPVLSRPSGSALMLAGLHASPMTIVMQEADRDVLLEQALEMGVTDDRALELERKIEVLHPTGDFDPIDRRREEYEAARARRRAETGLVTVFHGGSLERKRKLDAGSAMIAKLAGEGVPVAGRWVTQHTPASNPFAKYDVPTLTGVGHAEYLERLVDGDVLWAATEYEGTGLSYMEAIRSGMIPVVFLDRTRWMEPRVPDGYPFVCERIEDMEPLIRKVVSEFDAVKAEWGERLVRHLDAWTPVAVGSRLVELVDRVVAGVHDRNVKVAMGVQPAFDLLEQAVREEGWTEVDDPFLLWNAMTVRSRAGLDFRSWISPLTLRWMLIALGFVDRCDRPGLSMERA